MRTRFPDLIAAVLAATILVSALPAAAGAQTDVDWPLVVIDAGHGGRDPGAVGPAGTREKDVTLAIARELELALRAWPRLDVRMTRDRDTLIALRDRPRYANEWRGVTATAGRPALFVSIHANAHVDRTARGVETYFLSEARTEDARRVAELENAAQQYEEPTADSDALRFMLSDLRQNLYLRDSSAGAATIQSRLAGSGLGPDRGVKQAAFVVLEGAVMPAVLIEVGFISNAAEERLLANPASQRAIASEIASAIVEFLDSTHR